MQSVAFTSLSRGKISQTISKITLSTVLLIGFESVISSASASTFFLDNVTVYTDRVDWFLALQERGKTTISEVETFDTAIPNGLNIMLRKEPTISSRGFGGEIQIPTKIPSLNEVSENGFYSASIDSENRDKFDRIDWAPGEALIGLGAEWRFTSVNQGVKMDLFDKSNKLLETVSFTRFLDNSNIHNFKFLGVISNKGEGNAIARISFSADNRFSSNSNVFFDADNLQVAVPEPLTILGAGTALGFGTFFKRKLSKKEKA